MQIDQRQFNAVQEQLTTFTPADAKPYVTFDISPVYTIVARVPKQVSNTLQTLTIELQNRFPEHYYYNPEQYHVTLLPIPTAIDLNKAIPFLAKILSSQTVDVIIQGTAVNAFGASIVAYPQISLTGLRDKIRQEFGTVLDYTEHRAVWDEIMWSSFMRFGEAPSPELLKVLRTNAAHEFGEFTVEHFEIWQTSSKVFEPSKRQLIHTF